MPHYYMHAVEDVHARREHVSILGLALRRWHISFCLYFFASQFNDPLIIIVAFAEIDRKWKNENTD